MSNKHWGWPEFYVVHYANLEVYALFVRFTKEMIARGFQRYSADAIFHRVRWETALILGDDSGFKINSVWIAYYVRLLLSEYPEFEGFFVLRASFADYGSPYQRKRLPEEDDVLVVDDAQW